MSRSIDPKCWECSQLDSQTARQLHGSEGDGCWNDKICHRRRSHYRHRADNNQKRKGQYAMAKAEQLEVAQAQAQVEQVPIQPKVPPVAILYLYREPRKDAHLHAIAVAVWQGDQKLKQIGPTHCMGMTNSQVRQYLIDVLKILQDEYRIREFEPEIYISPQFCPISPCPLKPLQ